MIHGKDADTDNALEQKRRHATLKPPRPPRVFKCCQKDLIFDFDQEKCIDPQKADWCLSQSPLVGIFLPVVMY